MIVRRCIYGTNAFPAFHIGTLMEQRDRWMSEARKTSDPDLRRLRVRYARHRNREILRTLAELKQRQLEWSTPQMSA